MSQKFYTCYTKIKSEAALPAAVPLVKADPEPKVEAALVAEASPVVEAVSVVKAEPVPVVSATTAASAVEAAAQVSEAAAIPEPKPGKMWFFLKLYTVNKADCSLGLRVNRNQLLSEPSNFLESDKLRFSLPNKTTDHAQSFGCASRSLLRFTNLNESP